MPSLSRCPGRLSRLVAIVVPLLIAAAVLSSGSLTRAAERPAPEARTPSIQYEEALAHASDPNRFIPGGRVALGFRPRAGDTSRVGGDMQRALPAGRVSGLEMVSRGARRGSAIPAALGAPSLADPTVEPSQSVTDAVSASPLASPAPGGTDGTGLQRQVIGFLPYWEVPDPDLTLRYDLLSTIAYFSVPADADGNLVTTNRDGSTSTGWGGWTSSRMTSVIDAAHANGTRVVLTVTLFAWSTSDRATQVAVLASDTKRQRLADQIAAAVRDRGADGVNVDAEPIASGYDDEFADFVQRLRGSLDLVAPGYEITVDATAEISNYPVEALVAPGAADAIFVMGYDFRGASTANAGSIAPLAGPAFDLAEAIGSFAARVPPDRLILGLPYYGRAWSTTSDAPNAKNQSGTRYGGSVTATYDTAAGLAAENGRRYDATEESAWTAYQRDTCTSTYGCQTSWRELYYDDAQSLAAKYDLVNNLGLRGAGMWALGYDAHRPELWGALAAAFLSSPSVPTQEPTLALTVSQNVILWGSQIRLTANFDSLGAGRLIRFEVSRDGSSFTEIATIAADAAGIASTLYAPSDNRYYRAVFQGAADLAPRQSTDVRVVVRQWAPLRPFSLGRTVRAGAAITLTTTVRPSRADLPAPVVRYVQYRLSGGLWRLVRAEDVLADASGVAHWTVSFPGRASWYVRSMALPTALNANSAWSQVNRYESR